MLQSAELKMQSLRSTQSQIGWLEVVSWSPWEAPKIWPQRPCFQLVLQIWLCGERPSLHLESMRKRRWVTRLSSRKIPAMFHGVENIWPKTQRRVLPGIGPGTLRPEIWWTAKRLMCHSMRELPYVESFVIDDTVMVVGSIQDLILCGQL